MRLVTLLAYTNSLLLLALIMSGISIFRSSKYKSNFKKIHRIAGYGILVIGLLHGFIAVGGFRLHPGYLFYSFIVVNVLLILLFKHTKKPKKKKVLLKLHKYFPSIIFIFWLLHALSMKGLI